MTQNKFDAAEFLVSNKNELFHDLGPELLSILQTKRWFENQGLSADYEVAFADWLVYKLVWLYSDHTGKPYEESSSLVDKSFVVDLFGEEVLASSYWEKKV